MRFLIATVCSILLAPALAVGGITLRLDVQPSSPDPLGSLDHNHLGPDSPLVGTNLNVPTEDLSESSATFALGAYLDFTTGAYLGTDASGVAHYGSGGDFFALGGPLASGAGTPPLAYDLDTGPSTVTPEEGGTFVLSMTFTNAFLSSTVGAPFGVAAGHDYAGTLTLTFVNDPALAGNQVLSGSITVNLDSSGGSGSVGGLAVPEPASGLLLALGMALAAVGIARWSIRSEAGREGPGARCPASRLGA
jgi:hypothetical protein